MKAMNVLNACLENVAEACTYHTQAMAASFHRRASLECPLLVAVARTYHTQAEAVSFQQQPTLERPPPIEMNKDEITNETKVGYSPVGSGSPSESKAGNIEKESSLHLVLCVSLGGV